MKSLHVASLALAALASTLASRDARAVGPVDLELAAKAGGATNPASGSINPLGFGLGGRAGISVVGIYAGLNVVYYVGGSDGGISEHALQYGFEGGYGVRFADIVTLRPQLGVGNITFSGTGTLGPFTSSSSDSNVYLEPGVTLLVSVGAVFIGADVNALIVPGIDTFDTTTLQRTTKTETALTMHGQVGVKF